jgi:aminodeoxyfutalosine deaminase
MSTSTLRARWVLPMDRPPIAGGCVTVGDGQIVAVDAQPPAGAVVTDLGDVALLPGLVNAHTHLEFSDLAAPLGRPGMTLPEWIRLVIGERKRASHDQASAIATGLAESLACGVTTVGEISTAPAVAYEANGLQPSVVTFQESIGFSAQRVDSAFADVEQRFCDSPHPSGLSPHAPYTVHPRLLDRIVEMAAARGAPVAMHLAESPEELELLATGDGPFRELLEERSMCDAQAIPRGSRPMDYLQRLAAAPRALVIHGNYLTADELEFCGQRRHSMSVVYCPRTHAYFGHAPYPLAAMLQSGVRVALGTDSRASNPDLNLLAEARFAAQHFPQVEPAAWLRMATLDAAVALGLGAEIGSLTPGKRADVIAVPCAAADPFEAIIGGEAPARQAPAL